MKIKYILLTMLLLLCAFMTANAEETPLRVGLFYGSTAKESIAVSCGTGFNTVEQTPIGTDVVAAITPDNNVAIYNTAWDTLLYLGTGGAEVKLFATDGVVNINGKKYRGNVIFRPQEGKLVVINEVNGDDYLRGVVPGEMPSSWPHEALKAQAVAARCFAYRNLGKHSQYGFDLCATTNCQVYGGIASETEATDRAVYETAGIVAVSEGKIIDALYCSSNGGYAEGSENVWGGKVSYFNTFKDEYEKTENIKSAVWREEYSAQDIKDELTENGVDIGDIIGMEIVKTSDSGRVLEVKITGTTGQKSYTKAYARSFLGLKSQLYTITSPNSSSLYVLGANGKKSISGDYYVLTADGLTKRSAPITSDKYVVSGRGYGHGVGMSQWGAYYMASEGLNYVDIITYYYKGVQIVNYPDI